MKKFLGVHGQASAPFELFVAVIIMAFVVIVGYSMLTYINREICLNSVDKEMTKFKLNLEDTVNRKSSTKFSFHPDSACFASKKTVMKIELYKEPQTCAARCPSSANECYLMTFSNPMVANAFRQKCLELPELTNFISDQSTICRDDLLGSEGYNVVDPTMEGITPGVYVLKNATPLGEAYTKVCVWHKES
jgi:hypothetical protein